MGKKGEKSSSAGQQAADQYLEQLSSIEGITSKKMFGGHGIFHEAKMFGMVDSKGILRFKVTDKNLEKYEAAGCEKMGRMPYFNVPEEVIASDSELIDWAKEAIAISK